MEEAVEIGGVEAPESKASNDGKRSSNDGDAVMP